MKNVKIENACSENWNEMSTTEKGAFCQVCATNVVDFTNKSGIEIKRLLLANKADSMCVRVKNQQLATLNREFEAWQLNSKHGVQRAMLFSLLVVFGLSLFSCSNEQDKQTIQALQTSVSHVITSQNTVDQLTVSPTIKLPIGDSNELLIPEMVEDACKCDYLVYENPPIEEVVIEEEAEVNDHVFITMGGMSYTTIYRDFIAETVQPIEYDENGVAIPTELTAKAYPNPTADFTTLEIGLPEKERAEISVFNMNGQLLQTIYSGKIERGTSSYSIDLSSYVTGIYLITIRSKKYNETVRVSRI